MENVQATPQQLEEVKNILANDTPENREKYAPVFSKAEELGMLKKEVADPVLSEIKTRFGDGYASKEEFFSKVDEWKKQGSVNEEIFRSLPEPLFNAFQAYASGQDWTQAIKGTNLLDLKKNYSEDELLSIYMPNKFTKEELEDSENIAVQKAKQQSKQAFELDKQAKSNQELLNQDRIAQSNKRAKETLERTIEDFKKKTKMLNPNIKADILASWEQRLRTELTSAKFQEKFLDGKGGFTEEAASNLFPLVFPTEFTAQWKNTGRQSAEKEMQDILNRGGKPTQFERKAPLERTDRPEISAREVLKQFTQGESNPYKLTQLK